MNKADCPRCEGDGYFITGLEAGFNSRTMEVYPVEVKQGCSHCDCKGQVDAVCEECNGVIDVDYYEDKFKEKFLLCKSCGDDFNDRNK
jgi:RecJ-like exonuclease